MLWPWSYAFHVPLPSSGAFLTCLTSTVIDLAVSLAGRFSNCFPGDAMMASFNVST